MEITLDIHSGILGRNKYCARETEHPLSVGVEEGFTNCFLLHTSNVRAPSPICEQVIQMLQISLENTLGLNFER